MICDPLKTPIQWLPYSVELVSWKLDLIIKTQMISETKLIT